MLKGYRTLFFGFATILLGLLGKHAAPEVINAYLDVIFAVVGIGIIGLRLITTSPFGRTALHDVGLSDAKVLDLSNLTASLDPGSTATLNSLNAAVTQLTGHPLLQPATADVLSQLAEAVPNVLSALSSAQAAAEPAKAEPSPDDEAHRIAPQPPLPISDPARASTPETAPASQIQQ